jgi:hypothetical protein
MTAEIIFQTPDGESIGGKTNQGAGLGEGEGRGCFWHPRVSTGGSEDGKCGVRTSVFWTLTHADADARAGEKPSSHQ